MDYSQSSMSEEDNNFDDDFNDEEFDEEGEDEFGDEEEGAKLYRLQGCFLREKAVEKGVTL